MKDPTLDLESTKRVTKCVFVPNKPDKVYGFGFRSVLRFITNAWFGTVVTMEIIVITIYCE